MARATERKFFSLLLALLLFLPVSFSAAEIPLPVTLLTDPDSRPMVFLFSEPKILKLSQFDENRTEQLNKLIGHLSMEVRIDGDLSRTGIMIDQNEAFSYLQKEMENGAEIIYSFAPSAVSDRPSNPDETDPDAFSVFLENYLIDTNRTLDELYSLFSAVPGAFEDKARKEGTELRFSGFGKAVQRVTVSFPAAFVKESFPAALSGLSGDHRTKDWIDSLTFDGNQKIGLLYDAEGRIVRITYDGKVGKTPDSMRKVALVWKVLREETHIKDSVSLKTPAVAGADKDNMALERDLDFGSPDGVFAWNIQLDHRAGKEDRKLTAFTADLKSDASVISGTMEYSYKRDGNNPRIKVLPEFKRENGGEYSGTLEIAEYSGKIEKNHFQVHIKLQEGEAIKWPEGEKKTASAPEEAGETADPPPEETAAAILIQRLFELPEEDLLYFSSDIPASMWRELIQ